MHVIYLAGGIASGKSTISRTLQECGAVRIDLDDLSREALAADSPILPQIKAEFGDDILNPAGSVKRELLAQRAFSSTERAVTLEEIELPLIDKLLRERIAELAAQEEAERAADPAAAEKVVVVAGPLLGHEGLIKEVNRRKSCATLEIDLCGRKVATRVGLAVLAEPSTVASRAARLRTKAVAQ